MTLFLNNFFIIDDAPRAWGVYFQDSASPQMEALVELHDNIMFYLVIILFGVSWIMISRVINSVNKHFKTTELIELIWTVTPALILILIAFPSFKLLYLMDEVTDPSFKVFVEGHQWYWNYQYPNFLNEDDEELEFDSYLDSNLFSDSDRPTGENLEEGSEVAPCDHDLQSTPFKPYEIDGGACDKCGEDFKEWDVITFCVHCPHKTHGDCDDHAAGYISTDTEYSASESEDPSVVDDSYKNNK